MTRLTLISRGINRTVVSTPYAFTMPIASPDELFVKNKLNFYQVSNLKNRIPALYRSIPIIEKTISYKIANYTPTLSGICNVYNRLNTYGATISITQLAEDSYLYALLPIIGLVCGISISYLCNSFVHSFLGDYVAVDFLAGGAIQIASSVFLSIYVGAVIGICAGYPFKQYGQYVGQMVTSTSDLLGSQ
jgi:hypothetical protein